MPDASSSSPAPVPTSADESNAVSLRMADLARLEQVSPELRQWYMEQTALHLAHQRAVEVRGQHYALISALAGLLVALIAFVVGAITNHAAASIGGGVIGVVDLVALVTAFLTGRSSGKG